jgi:hypothetical protein
MSEERSFRAADVVILILLLAVMVGGFWMTSQAVDGKMEALAGQVATIQQGNGQVLEKLADIRNVLGELKRAHQAGAAPAPAAAPAAPAAAPAAPPPPAAKAPAGAPAKPGLAPARAPAKAALPK